MADRAARSRVRTRFFDQLAVAAEAVALGSAHEAHWQTLAAFAERDGVDHVAQLIAQRAGAQSGTRAWWRCTLLLSMELSAEDSVRVTHELIAIEQAGGGPVFDLERHALLVSAAVRYLEEHLARLHAGTATNAERCAIEPVVNAARVAKARGRSL